ncbi:hypothetical protein Hypma_012719 [Hypsizygus marmoreus]|uniref:Uncharacterized protein n=1 Tax=Hypsizygus marmoreus TaxID=39966 RepID=A0A369KEE0_HYPMA|nr:hypothetical protein Hypma_012719 [Hypsizygus marmoreus]
MVSVCFLDTFNVLIVNKDDSAIITGSSGLILFAIYSRTSGKWKGRHQKVGGKLRRPSCRLAADQQPLIVDRAQVPQEAWSKYVFDIVNTLEGRKLLSFYRGNIDAINNQVYQTTTGRPWTYSRVIFALPLCGARMQDPF